MRVTGVRRRTAGGNEAYEIQLVADDGTIWESIMFHATQGGVATPAGYSPTEAGAKDYGRTIWCDHLPPEERPF